MENNEAPAKARGKAPPWKKGQSGNPAGTKRGSRHKASLIAECLLDGETKELVRKAIDLALKGDTVALRLCLERILPPLRERPCSFKLPKIESLNDASNALAMIIARASSGELLPSEAESLANVVNGFAKLLELAEIETRLTALEQASAGATSGRFNA
jgi:hypothetical protein